MHFDCTPHDHLHFRLAKMACLWRIDNFWELSCRLAQVSILSFSKDHIERRFLRRQTLGDAAKDVRDGDSPGRGCFGDAAMHCEQRRHLQVWCRGRAHARHPLQELPKNAAQRPHIDGRGVPTARHHHLRQTAAAGIKSTGSANEYARTQCSPCPDICTLGCGMTQG